jgi:hypothetical protein
MNTRIFLITIAFIAGLFFTACEKDDETNPKPVITLSELGYENSKIGYAGTDLHIEAEIVAKGKVDKITIEIHLKANMKKKVLQLCCMKENGNLTQLTPNFRVS